MKKYFVIHRNFVHLTSYEGKVRVFFSKSKNLLTESQNDDSDLKIIDKEPEETLNEICNEPKCLGGVKSDFCFDVWHMFDETRNDINIKNLSLFPKILEKDIHDFLNHRCCKKTLEVEKFEKMNLSQYNQDFNPRYSKIFWET